MTVEHVEIKMDLRPGEEIFTHKDDDGTFRHFPVRIMREFAEKYNRANGKCTLIGMKEFPKLDDETVELIKENMGVEQERLDRLVEPYLSRPVISILWEDNKHSTIVDGNHRVVKLHSLNKGFKSWVFVYPMWTQFCLDNLYEGVNQEELLKGRSGVIEAEQMGLL